MKNIKQDFPIFKRKINGKPLVYLDSASTSQKPQAVIDAVVNLYKNSNANIHRGIYSISEEATALFENTRNKVAKFINAKDPSEIIFTHNTTHALNIVAYGLKQFVKKGDVILISEMEHHSNHVPWQRLARETGARLLFISINDGGLLAEKVVDANDKVIFDSLKKIPHLKIVALAHVSNVLGAINPVKEIFRKLRTNNYELITILDAAQSVPHMPVDVQDLGCDFLAFSAHKMLGPTGVGVLWGKKELLNSIEPVLVGSHMIREVGKDKSVWDELPAKFEPGTAAIEGVIGFGAAIDYLNVVGMENVFQHEQELISYCLSLIAKIDGLKIYGPKNPKYRGGVVSFKINGIHPHDISQVLSEDNIYIRSGHHCAMPLHKKLGAEASSRVSFYLYNTKEDIDTLILGLQKVIKLFKK